MRGRDVPDLSKLGQPNVDPREPMVLPNSFLPPPPADWRYWLCPVTNEVHRERHCDYDRAIIVIPDNVRPSVRDAYERYGQVTVQSEGRKKGAQ